MYIENVGGEYFLVVRRPLVLEQGPIKLKGSLLEFRSSQRERQVLELVCEGHQNKEIAWRLHVSARTVKYHISSLLSKAGVRSRVDLMKLHRMLLAVEEEVKDS